jgi:hypothetical protein
MTENTMAAPAKQGGVFEDILEVLWAPAKVFERSRAAGVGMYLLALTVIMVVLVVATKGLLQPYLEAGADQQLLQQARQSGRELPAEAVTAARSFTVYAFLAGIAMTPLVGGLMGGILIWLAAKLLRAPLAFGRAVFIAVLSTVPRVIGTLVTAIQGAIVDPASVTSMYQSSIGPARFADPETTKPVVMGLLANFDLFSIWALVITAIGVSVLARVPRSTGWIVAIVSTSIGLLPVLLAALK